MLTISSDAVKVQEKVIHAISQISLVDVDHLLSKASIRHLNLDPAKLGLQPDRSLDPLEKLSEVFNDPLLEKHLHIIIQAPPAANLPSEPQLVINCLVRGDDSGRAFSVKIAKSETVGALKDAIKKKMEHACDGIDAVLLDLWKVSDSNLPDDRNLKDKISELKLDDKQPLSPMAKLSTVFSEKPEDEHLHIVVRVPPAGELVFFFARVEIMVFPEQPLFMSM
jgi:hypothetical protein